MTLDSYSLRKLSANFIIPLGSQVVLRVNKPLPDGRFKPPGSVAEVVAAPDDNSKPYTIRFANGQTIEARFEELALRRREMDDELVYGGDDLRNYIIYRCQVGSRAFGLATEDSDDDIRGIYLPPARLQWSLYKLPEQLEFADDSKDEVYWELEKYLRLALKANPNILETLWTPMVLQADEIAERLRELRAAFLSRHLYKTYSGYVLSQFRRMNNAHEKTGKYKAKHAMHLIRLLYSGIAALRDGEIRVDVGEHRDELLAIKSGALTFSEAKAKALELDGDFQGAYENTTLPDEPDYKRVNEFLIWARRKMVDA